MGDPLVVVSIPPPVDIKTKTYSVFLRRYGAGYFKHMPRAVLHNREDSKSRIAVCTDRAMCRSQLRSSPARPTAARWREARSSVNRLSVSIRFERETNIVGALSAGRKMGRREKPDKLRGASWIRKQCHCTSTGSLYSSQHLLDLLLAAPGTARFLAKPGCANPA